MMKKIILSLFLTIASSFCLLAQSDFVTVWDLPSGEDSLIFRLSTTTTVSYTWQCVGCFPFAQGSGNFPANLNYETVTVNNLPLGAQVRINIHPNGLVGFRAFGNNAPDLVDVEQWGTAAWLNANGMFNTCQNLTITATDVPNFSNVDNMNAMFQDCDSLTTVPNMNNWDVSNVITMDQMFFGATNFNEDIGGWNVGNVVSTGQMFRDASSFNQDLNNWDVSNVTNFVSCFRDASSFNGNISSWDVSSATNMFLMFTNCSSFNQAIGNWDVSNVTLTGFMFSGCTVFNQPLNNWDVSNVTNLRSMFENAAAFNQPLNNWDISSNDGILSNIFNGALSFNQPLNNWDVSNATSMSGLFIRALAFNQDISGWDVSNVGSFTNFFNINGPGSFAFSRTNYDALLNAWASLNLQSNITIRLDDIPYCAGDSARTYIENTFNWTFQNDVLNCSSCITPVTATDTRTACDSFTWLDGNTYNSSNNTATFTLVAGAANGCDSIVALDLTINTTPALSLSQNGNTLEATPGFANYNWFNVATGAISGANLATFTPTASGDYFVEVDNNGCIGTSNTIDFTLPLAPLVLVSSITVQGQNGDSSITTQGGTLQMEASVLPTNATDGSFTWSVVNGTGYATIDANGLLTAAADGTVEVSATANDASGVTGSKTITISNQTVGINDVAFENLSIYPNPTSGKVNLDVSERLTSIHLMDLTGKTIQAFDTEAKQLDISAFTQGIYFLEIANADRKSVIKILKK